MNTGLSPKDNKMLDVISKWSQPPLWKKRMAWFSFFGGILMLGFFVLECMLVPGSSHLIYLLGSLAFLTKFLVQSQEYHYQRILWLLMHKDQKEDSENPRKSIFV